MAERKPLYLDADGFPTEMSTLTDSMTLDSLTVQGTAGITMVSGTVTGLPTPTAAGDAAPKSYVDSIAQGLTPKQSVRATTSGVDLSDHVGGSSVAYSSSGGAGGTGQFTDAPTTVDGVSLAQDDRVLVKDQDVGTENGLYVVTSTTSTWDRASDFDEDDEALAGSAVWVTEGSINADTLWVVTTDNPITLNSTAINWSQFSGVGDIIAGSGMTKTLPNQLNVIGGAGIIANTDDVAVELDTDADAQGTGADGGSSGLEFDASGVAGQLRAKVDPAGGIQRGASGLLLEIDDTPDTLDVDADGLKVVGLPSLFKINDVSTGATVTAANLDTLTDGSNADALHVHSGADEAQRIENDYTTDGSGVTAGDPVYVSANNTVSSANANNNNTRLYIGIAKSTVGASSSVSVVSAGVATGLTVAGSPSAGDLVYLAVGGGLTVNRPTGTGEHVLVVGKMKNGTDLHIEPQYLGKNT